MHLGKYTKAASDYQRAIETATNDTDKQRVKVLIDQNTRHSIMAAEATAKHKEAMSKAFVIAEADNRVTEKLKKEEELRKKEELRELKRKKMQKPKAGNAVVMVILGFCGLLVLFVWTRKLYQVHGSVGSQSDGELFNDKNDRLSGEF